MLDTKRKSIVATLVQKFESLNENHSFPQLKHPTTFRSYLKIPTLTIDTKNDVYKDNLVSKEIIVETNNSVPNKDVPVQQKSVATSDIEKITLTLKPIQETISQQSSWSDGEYVNLDFCRKDILRKVHCIDWDYESKFETCVENVRCEEKNEPIYENLIISEAAEDQKAIYQNLCSIVPGLSSSVAGQQNKNSNTNCGTNQATPKPSISRKCPVKPPRKRYNTHVSDVEVEQNFEGDYVILTKCKPGILDRPMYGKVWNSTEELQTETGFNNHICKCNSAASVNGPRRESKEVLNDQSEHIINELITTEENYIDRLQFTKDQFQDWLLNKIGPKNTEDIFNKTALICEESAMLLRDIKSVREDYEAVGHKFIQHKNLFERYPSYCRNLKKARELICHKQFHSLIKRRELELNTDLHDLIVAPPNRLVKYKILLSTLFKNIAKQNLPAANIQNALNLVKKIADKCDNLMELDYIRNKPRNYRYGCIGKFHFRDNFRQLTPEKANVTMFLFEKKIIITKKDNAKKENYFFIDDIDVQKLCFFANPKKHTIFSLIKYERKGRVIYRMDSQNEEIAQKWSQTINPMLWKILDEERKKRNELHQVNAN